MDVSLLGTIKVLEEQSHRLKTLATSYSKHPHDRAQRQKIRAVIKPDRRILELNFDHVMPCKGSFNCGCWYAASDAVLIDAAAVRKLR